MEQLIGMWARLILSKLYQGSDETHYAIFYTVMAFLFLAIYMLVN